jgi:hypothetical protein
MDFKDLIQYLRLKLMGKEEEKNQQQLAEPSGMPTRYEINQQFNDPRFLKTLQYADDADRAMIEERQKRELTPAEKEYVYRVWLSNNPGRR